MGRIFVGIKLDKKLTDQIGQFRNKFTTLAVRWVPDQNLHITLIPPWNESDVDGVKNSLSAQKSWATPFEINFERIRFGPNPQHPRLIWALGVAPKSAIELRKVLERRLGKENFHQVFKLHLTLARFNPQDFKKFIIKNLNEKVSWKQKVSSFCLIESELLPRGAKYTILQQINLK